MSFKIKGQPVEPFQPFFGLPDNELAEQHIVRIRVPDTGFYPCRVLLEDARPGESVLLLNHEYQPIESPYRGRHAIFVNEAARAPRSFVDEVPPILGSRKLISLRAFDRAGMMVDAEVIAGHEVHSAIVRLLANQHTEYLHAHNVARGCFAARIDRDPT